MFIYTAEKIKEIDKKAEEQGLSQIALMENAGRGIAMEIKRVAGKTDQILILAGRGNNGGDGIVAARYLLQAGYRSLLTFPLGEPKTEAAKAHWDYFQSQGYKTGIWSEQAEADIIVDALLGISMQLPLRKNAAELVQWCNKQDACRIAVDLPTGVQADCGEVNDNLAFRADYTVTLHGAKPSAFLLPSGEFYGKVTSIDIGLKQDSDVNTVTAEQVQESIPKRSEGSHKGTFGMSLLLAGSDEMPGSATLAAIGAIRSGTGRLVIGTTPFAASIIASAVPEATYDFNGLENAGKGELPEKTSAVGIGPGLADETLVANVLDKLMQKEIPLVVDAGALLKRASWQREAPLVLAPHPGEFSRLTGKSIKEIQANRIAVAQEFAIEHDLILVLKGQHTVIAMPDGRACINPTGNSGLAKGGSGDVLMGIILSMLSYYKSAEAAVVNAVYVHGFCAEKWAENNSEASMSASDFQRLLPQVFKELEERRTD